MSKAAPTVSPKMACTLSMAEGLRHGRKARKRSLGYLGRGWGHGAWRLVHGLQDPVAGGNGGAHRSTRAIRDPCAGGVACTEFRCGHPRHGPLRTAAADFDCAFDGQ